MDQAAKLLVFQAQVENVRSLKASIGHVHRTINSALRRNDAPTAATFTKLYAVLFCALAEANFSKVLHTPYGLSLDRIAQVQTAKSEKGIVQAWKKMIALGIDQLDAKRGNFAPNTQQRLNRAVDDHVLDPSLLRNKLAHGQWVKALNRDNDALQPDLTNQIADLDIVKISAWKLAHDELAKMVEHLVESPQKTFVRDWYAYVIALEERITEAEHHTLEEHVKRLIEKDRRTGAHSKH